MMLAYPLIVPGGQVRHVATRPYTARDARNARKLPPGERYELVELAVKAGIGIGHVLDLDLVDVARIEEACRRLTGVHPTTRPTGAPMLGIISND